MTPLVRRVSWLAVEGACLAALIPLYVFVGLVNLPNLWRLHTAPASDDDPIREVVAAFLAGGQDAAVTRLAHLTNEAFAEGAA